MKPRFFSVFIMLIFSMLLMGKVSATIDITNNLKPASFSQTTNGTTTRVSVDSNGNEGNATSGEVSISADGRYVTFYSASDNLVAGDTYNRFDVFLHDLQTGGTSRISVASDGTQGTGDSSSPSMTPDGRYISFFSHASNLVDNDTNGFGDVFVHDRVTKITSRVSMDSDNNQSNGHSGYQSISSDGRYVAFYSAADNLVEGDTNGVRDIFVHDRVTGLTTRVSESTVGVEGNGDSTRTAISGDGKYVAFCSEASNLVSNDTNGYIDAFVHDRDTRETWRVSVATDGTEGNTGMGSCTALAVSEDGHFVAFRSSSNNLDENDTNNKADIFVHNLQTGETNRVSLSTEGVEGNDSSDNPDISADGRYVTFQSSADNLDADCTNGHIHVYAYDRQTEELHCLSVSDEGTQGNSTSWYPAISADGQHVAFSSRASNLISNDTNGVWDAFVHDFPNPTMSFLDLPIDYSSSTFARTVQGNVDGKGVSGCVNSWFDHQYPTYDGSPNNSAPGMRRWDGSYFPDGNGIGSGWYDGHAGVDFCRQISTNAIAAADGNVISVTSNCVEGDRSCGDQIGNNVWIDHENGYVTIYGHLVQGNGIPLGRISKGDPVGQIGNTGNSAGAHLHFEVRYDADENGQWSFSEVVDPYGWNPLSDPNQIDPWSVKSHYLWQYPLNEQVTMDNTGGTISSVSGATNVNVPSGALTSLLTLDLWEAPPVADASAQLRSVGFSSWLRVLEWLSGSNNVMATTAVNEFEQPVTLTIDYSEANLTHLDESQLAIHWWDSVNNEWQILSTSVNTVQKTATAQTIQTGNFDLQAPLLCSADVREPDDNYYAATSAIADGTLWNQRFGVSEDEDWFKFEAVAGEKYLVETSNLATGVDTRLEIYDQDGLALLSSDDNSGTGMGSYLQWVAPREGIYFVRIAQANSSSYGCDAAYDFSITGTHKVYLPSIMNLP